MSKSENRIESLHGLRAFSTGLVVVSHLIGVRGFFVPERLGRFYPVATDLFESILSITVCLLSNRSWPACLPVFVLILCV
jgi:hypothetical protein